MAINKTINKSAKSHGALRNCIEYVLKEQKITDGLVYMTGPAPDEINWDSVYQAFLEEKRLWNKDSGRMYNHNIISFHKDEAITPQQAFDFGKEFAEKWFPGYQTLISVHQDRDHVHIHLVTNTVSYIDGRKLHNSRADLQKMKDFTNEMCMDRGLSIAEKGRHFDGTEIDPGETIAWSKDKYHLIANDKKKSYVVDCAVAVMEAKENCPSREDFIRGMEERGWHTSWTDNRKHITFENGNGEKVRDSNLSKSFSIDISKEVLLHEFERQNELRLSRLKAERDRAAEREQADAELREYYAEIESAIAGAEPVSEAIGGVNAGNGAEGQALIRGEVGGSGKDIGAFLADIDAKEQDIGNAVEAPVRDSRSERRAVRHAEAQSVTYEQQSITDAEQRRLEEQRRLDAEKRAAELRREAFSFSYLGR